MVDRGAEHLKALCVVAAALADRAWAVMNRQMPYVICDVTGEPVTPDQAKHIIAENYTVPDDVRSRSRSSKSARRTPPPERARPLSKATHGGMTKSHDIRRKRGQTRRPSHS